MKKSKIILIGSCMVLGLCSCGKESTPHIAYTYSVDSGDDIKISLDSSDGYALSSEVPFAISCDGEVLSQGSFVLAESYSQYETVVSEDANATLLDAGEKDGNEYIFWSYNDSEFNYAILVDDSNTAIVIGNVVSEESATECFERLEISVE